MKLSVPFFPRLFVFIPALVLALTLCPTATATAEAEAVVDAFQNVVDKHDSSTGVINEQIQKGEEELADEDFLPYPSILRYGSPTQAPAQAPTIVTNLEIKNQIPSQSRLRRLTGDPPGPSIPVDTPTQPPAPTGGVCLSGSTIAHVRGKGTVAMRDLNIGDEILVEEDTASGTGDRLAFQPIYAFAHSSEKALAKFLKIKTTSAHAPPLEISPEHMIFLKAKENPVRADSLKVGDILQARFVGEGGETGAVDEVVVQIDNFYGWGLYAPLTRSGTLYANGIKVSSYISLQSNATEFLEFKGGISTGLSQEKAVHMALAPLRIICRSNINSHICQDHDKYGMLKYVAHGLNFAHWVDELNLFSQLLVFVAFAALVGSFMAMEYVFETLPFSVVVIGMAFIAVIFRSRFFVRIQQSVKTKTA